MNIALYGVCALFSYLFCGMNPAIILARVLYGEDIRKVGSHNPGFTNFKRTYGGKYAWCVLVLDLLKAVLCCLCSAALFASIQGCAQLGAAVAGLFAMLGHCYPIWYHFRGGKAFLVAMGALWCVDWRAGLMGTCVLAMLFFTLHYMSVATLTAMLAGTLSLLWLGTDHVAVFPLCMFACLLLIWRHRGNLHRLAAGQEPRFYLSGKQAHPQTAKEDAKHS